MGLAALDGSPTAQVIAPTRNQEVGQYASDYGIRNPSAAPVVAGSQAYIAGQVLADQTAGIYYNAIVIANAATRQSRTGQQLDAIDGVNLACPRNPAQGASGGVIVNTGPAGATIVAGDQCVLNGFTFQCAFTGTYQDGAIVPVTSIAGSVGYATNQPAGATGVWSSPRPGCFQPVTVYEQEDESGLSGGAPVESDAQYRIRLNERAQNPPASGNDAQYQLLVAQTPTVAVQQCFTYPGCMGPASTCILFTLRPAQPGAPRIPNATQVQAVLAWIQGQMPKTDSIYMGAIVANPINVNLEIEWEAAADGWVDQQPWPPYVAGAEIAVDGAQVNTPTTFYLTGNNGTNPPPAVGQSIAMFDLVNLTFHQKTILSVTVVGTDWQIAVDPTTSDVTYTPFGGQVVGPWSDSLVSLVVPVVAYLDTLGPGEQFADADFIDPGLRQRRSPPNPSSWPSEVGNRLIAGIFPLPAVADVVMLNPSPVPYEAPIGAPGVSALMTTLLNLACFPEG